MTRGIYDLPHYYDIAFSWDMRREIAFLGRLFSRFVPYPVRRVLEPACGTGRFLLALPAAGYRVTGYDSSAVMVEYASRRISAAGLALKARAICADMRTAALPGRFDAAINSINSIGYLLSDSDFVSHLRATARNLRPDAVYVLHLSTAHRRPADTDDGWTAERDGVKIRTRWDVVRQDRRRRLSQQLCRMEIDDHGRRVELADHHTLRLWFLRDLRRLLGAARAFRLAAVYTDDYFPVPHRSTVTGEQGNHYYVLKKL